MLSAILSLAAPAILGPAGLAISGMTPTIASAIGGGLGALLQGGGTDDALRGAALGGLGGFLGGKLAGTSDAFGTMNPANVSTTAGGQVLPSAMTGGAEQIATEAIGKPSLMSALTRPEAIGAGIGGLAADSMAYKPMPFEEREKKIFPEGMAPKNTVRFPTDRDKDDSSEFDYRFAPNYMAEGGPVEDDMAAMDMGLGGMTEEGMNDKELISSAIDVIQGEISDPDEQQVILGQFVAQFGQDALQDLVARVQSGDIPSGPQEGDGMVEGAGDGMADMIPASMEGDQDVLLSDGEFVVPADVVSGIGNGSSDAGANKLEDMMDRVRELRTGGKTQPPAIPDEMMLPA